MNVGDVTWTITNATQVDQLDSQFGEPKQGSFVVVDFDFVNNSDEAVALSDGDLSLFDDQDRESDPDDDAYQYIPNRRAIIYEDVNPGVTRQGRVIFSVAPDASGFRLEVRNPDVFSDESGEVNLGI